MRRHLLGNGLGAALLVLGLAQSGCSTSAFCFADCGGDTSGTDLDGGNDGAGGTGGNDGGIFTDGNGGFIDGNADVPETCTVTNGGSEICDGLDNDCNGVVDDNFDMQDKAHCGTCDNNCVTQMINADPDTVTCDWDGTPNKPGTCGFTSCLQDWYNIDQDPTNGCEYACVQTATDDTLCNNRDDDCDGLRDEDVDLCTSVADCGRCGGACVVLHGTPTCDHPSSGPCDSTNTKCAIASCADDNNDGQPDWWDLDKSYATGCEYHCSRTNGGVEICGDGVDNDCDGKIDGADDDLSGDPQLGKPCFGDPDGVCATAVHAGLTVCKGQKVECQGPDVIVQGQVPETCNGLDDDCNGIVDDHLTDVGKSCGASNIFPCALGSEQCVGGQLTCVGAVPPGVEVCNGMDDDCDGQIDNNATDAVGTCGQSDVGECKLGNKVCTGGAVLCVGAVDPTPELCNGKDDNCDGQLDNAPTDAGGSCGQNNTAPCKFGTLACQSGALACVGNVDPGSETCNGIDDDCNGIIDDNVPGAGVACGQSNTYPCKKGAMQCQGGAMLCVGAVEPKAEVCNGEDDDCNGVIDDSTTDSGGDCGQSNTAPCKFGKLECKAGALSCTGNVDPTPETCNGKDDNCDGQIDNNPSGIGADCGQSNTAPCMYGKTQCQNGALACVGAVDPTTETCNGADDDCDGVIDDNPTGTGQSCGLSNVFPCASGSMQCQGGTMTCVGNADPNPEVCNGVDDDCDGVIDNNLTDITGTCGQSNVGACKFGNKACVGGSIVCQGNVDPKPELCNSVDDDCDGTVDNNPTDTGASCGTNNTAPCKFGTIQCTNGTATCVGAIEPKAETCNGIDDSCNGIIDDGVPGAGVACGQSNTYPCKKGAMQCQGGAMVCVGAVDPKSETCNGIDDNCNGIIDDNTTDSGGSCGLSNTAPCKLGALQCQSGALKCVGNVDPANETCNGIDDNCNGSVDDSVPGTNADCGQNNTAPCKYGKIQCQAGSMVCVGNVDPKTETCNGIDDNCNGTVDDATQGSGQPCGASNTFPCSYGTTQCQAGALQCVGNVDPNPETCNGADDDCDGKIDLTGTTPPPDSVGACNVPPPAPPGATTPCKAGTKACVGGTVVCQGSVGPTGAQDTCKVDANCDGVLTNQPDLQTDVHNCGTCGNDCLAGAVHASWACVTGACQFQGCQTGYWDLNSDNKCEYACTFISASEACNGVDDNCNGTIDENVTVPSPVQLCGVSPSATAAECTSGVSVACTAGAWKCTFPAGVCSPTCATAAEVCDTLDNNCNGVLNENVPNYGKPCASDDSNPGTQGICRTIGTFVCSGANATVCSATIDNSKITAESCDGLDNDCDGSTDESFNAKGSNATYFVKPAVTKVAASLWVYSYEASRPSATTTSPGSGNGYTCTTGCPAGVPAAPAGVPLQATKSCSVSTKVPWFNVTPTEVEQNCSQMGGHVCSVTEWKTACHTNPPGATTCQWGYAPNGSACTTALGPPYAFPFPAAAAKWCNLGPTFDFGQDSSNGDQDGLLPTSSPSLKNCWSDWTALLANGATNGKIYDLTGNLREVTRSASNVYKLMGGAFNTGAESGATCDFEFYATDQNFQYFDLGFRCCFSADPRL